jgi:hypothetical protein
MVAAGRERSSRPILVIDRLPVKCDSLRVLTENNILSKFAPPAFWETEEA